MDYKKVPQELHKLLFEKFKCLSNRDRLLVLMYFLSDLEDYESKLSYIELELLKIFPPSLRTELLPKDYDNFQSSVIRGQFNNQATGNQKLWENIGEGCWKNTTLANNIAEEILLDLGLNRYIKSTKNINKHNIFSNLKQEIFFKDIDFQNNNEEKNLLYFELMLRQASSKYETFGDYIYFNFQNEELIEKILEYSNIEFKNMVRSKQIRNSFIVYLALVVIQLREYRDSFWQPIRASFSLYDEAYYGTQSLDGYMRKIIDATQQYQPKEIIRQSIKVQYDAGVSFYFSKTLFDICFDYYKSDLQYGLTESNFVDEAVFLSQVLKHRFDEDYGDEDEIKISSKVYTLIKSTRLRIKYTSNMIVDLFTEILRMINSYFWESEAYLGNHFLYSSFMEWADRNLRLEQHLDRALIDKKTEIKDHIVRKPNLYFYQGSIYYKIPNQKIKTFNEKDRIQVEIFHDEITTKYTPNVAQLMIGYELSGSKVYINDPFKPFGYRLLNGGNQLYESDIDFEDDYILFNYDTGKRLNNIQNHNNIVLLVKKGVNVKLYNTNIISLSTYNNKHNLYSLELSKKSIVMLDNESITTLNLDSIGVVVEELKYVKINNGSMKYKITNKVPKIILSKEYSNKRVLAIVNGHNYLLDTYMDDNQQFEEFEIKNFEPVEGFYEICLKDLETKQVFSKKRFFYHPEMYIDTNKSLYLEGEVPEITLTISDNNNRILYTSSENKIKINNKYDLSFDVPYVSWKIQSYNLKDSKVYVGDLPRDLYINTQHINGLDVEDVKVVKKQNSQGAVFDLRDMFNQTETRDVISVYARTNRGTIKLFDVYMKETLSNTTLFYDEINQVFYGEVSFIGNSRLEIEIESKSKKVNKQITDEFRIPFEKEESITLKIFKNIEDDFGINNEKVEIYSKKYNFIDPHSLIGRTIVSNVREKANKTEDRDSLFNIRIKKYIGDNNFYGEAFAPIYHGGEISFPKLSPVRIEFIDGNFSPTENTIKVYLNNNEEVPSEWLWNIEREKDDFNE